MLKKTISYCIRICLLSMMLLLCFSVATAHTAEQKPEEAIESFNTALLSAMKQADTLKYQGRYNLLEPVIKNVFALEFMGSKSLGAHWEKLTDKQKEIYMDAYIKWTIATYAGRFDGHSGETFSIKRSSVSGNTASVVSSINKPEGDAMVDFDYRMRLIDDKWRIVDIRIVMVSQLAMTRAQFVSMMNREGFDALVEMLKKKTAEFAAEKKD